MTIGEASKLVGLPTKTIRFYEDIKLLTSAKRSENNYRSYSDSDLNILFLIKEARDLGLDLNEVRNIVSLCLNQGCEHINNYLADHIPSYIESINKQMQRLTDLKGKLLDLEKGLKNKSITCDSDCNECNVLCRNSNNP
jgi:MerR family transcriptional regulator, copper efflux regulator